MNKIIFEKLYVIIGMKRVDDKSIRGYIFLEFIQVDIIYVYIYIYLQVNSVVL